MASTMIGSDAISNYKEGQLKQSRILDRDVLLGWNGIYSKVDYVFILAYLLRLTL
jgi:hypothetical protein